jgi:hypothetical protein
MERRKVMTTALRGILRTTRVATPSSRSVMGGVVPRPAPILSTILAVLAVASCSAPGVPDQPPRPGPSDPGFGHVHALDVNPGDGTVYAATHHGVFRLGPQGPERIAARFQDTMAFTIAGPDRFLASGHPDPGEPGPPHLGLVSSTDRAQTWTSVALRGEADFHALSAAGSTVYGFDSLCGAVMRSDDGGQNWQRGAELDVADLDGDPADPLHVLATTADGLQESIDGGMTFGPAAAAPPRPLVLLDHVERTGADREPLVAGVDAAGDVWSFGVAGWSRAGSLPGVPEAFTVISADRYLAATEDGVLSSDDAGHTWSVMAAAHR